MPRAARTSVSALIEQGARRLRRARVFFGHGTDNARDESAALVLHALGLAHTDPAVYARRVGARAQERVRALLTRRIEERIPAPYLTGESWFAGLPFYVDARVLIPRSAIAELIERRFAPWLEPRRITRVLDMGCGSGCIAIACAKALPWAQVDAADISTEALEVAARYDLIVANPPYVGMREFASLPPEYRHEPALALTSGRAGLDSVRVLLVEARRHLRPGGALIVEVGNTEVALARAFPQLPFLWLQFERGGGGVFLLGAEQLPAEGAPRARRAGA